MANAQESAALKAAIKNIKTGGRVGSAVMRANPDRRFRTGSFDMDHGLGGGGRFGTILGFFGEKSGGKTTTAKRIMGRLQNYCRNCLRPAHNIQAVEPSKEELAEDPGTRWSATGHCDCYAVGEILWPPAEPPKEKDEKPKAYAERVDAWRKALLVNSYEEYVCSWVDAEQAYDKAYAASLGVDNRRLALVTPSNAEEALDIMSAMALSLAVDFMVIDSIAQLTPRKEIEESMEDWQQGLAARLMNKGARKLVAASAHTQNSNRLLTQIWINQQRDKIGVMFGDPTVKPAGKGQDYAISAEVRFMKNTVKVVQEQYGAKDEFDTVPVTVDINFKITKNRTSATQGIEGSYTQLARANDRGPVGTVVEDEKIWKRAMHYLVVQDTKKGTYTLGDEVFTSQKGVLERIREDSFFRESVCEALLIKMLAQSGDVSKAMTAAAKKKEDNKK